MDPNEVVLASLPAGVTVVTPNLPNAPRYRVIRDGELVGEADTISGVNKLLAQVARDLQLS